MVGDIIQPQYSAMQQHIVLQDQVRYAHGPVAIFFLFKENVVRPLN